MQSQSSPKVQISIASPSVSAPAHTHITHTHTLEGATIPIEEPQRKEENSRGIEVTTTNEPFVMPYYGLSVPSCGLPVCSRPFPVDPNRKGRVTLEDELKGCLKDTSINAIARASRVEYLKETWDPCFKGDVLRYIQDMKSASTPEARREIKGRFMVFLESSSYPTDSARRYSLKYGKGKFLQAYNEIMPFEPFSKWWDEGLFQKKQR